MNQKKQAANGKIRVAVYCRFNHAVQENDSSFTLQKMSFLQEIKATPNWELADIYADLGVSGTREQPGAEFCRMLDDGRAGKIDIVLCTALSRFSRNSLMAIKRIRKFTDMGIRVIFEKEGIDTSKESTDLILAILAAAAQEEKDAMQKRSGVGQ